MSKKKFLDFLKFKKAVFGKQKKISIGTWLQIDSIEVASILARSNYDWIAVDLEHGSFSPSHLPNIFRTIYSESCIPFSRIKSSSKFHIQESLDAGALGIIVPNIETANQMQKVIEYSNYPPTGKRGVGFSSANNYGQIFDIYKKNVSSPIVIAMIESVTGLENLREILKVKGLSGILIGPYDLSASLNITGKFKNPKFIRSFEKILKLCKINKITAGFHQVNQNKSSINKLARKGFNFIPYGIDSVFLQNTYPLKNKKKQ